MNNVSTKCKKKIFIECINFLLRRKMGTDYVRNSIHCNRAFSFLFDDTKINLHASDLTTTLSLTHWSRENGRRIKNSRNVLFTLLIWRLLLIYPTSLGSTMRLFTHSQLFFFFYAKPKSKKTKFYLAFFSVYVILKLQSMDDAALITTLYFAYLFLFTLPCVYIHFSGHVFESIFFFFFHLWIGLIGLNNTITLWGLTTVATSCFYYPIEL